MGKPLFPPKAPPKPRQRTDGRLGDGGVNIALFELFYPPKVQGHNVRDPRSLDRDVKGKFKGLIQRANDRTVGNAKRIKRYKD